MRLFSTAPIPKARNCNIKLRNSLQLVLIDFFLHPNLKTGPSILANESRSISTIEYANRLAYLGGSLVSSTGKVYRTSVSRASDRPLLLSGPLSVCKYMTLIQNLKRDPGIPAYSL